MLVVRRAALALLAVTALAGPGMAQDKVTVAVTAIVEHPALDAARDGIKEALAEAPLRGWTLVSMQADWKTIFPAP